MTNIHTYFRVLLVWNDVFGTVPTVASQKLALRQTVEIESKKKYDVLFI